MPVTTCPGQPCSAPCAQGRACPARRVRAVEADHPWLLAVYAAALVLTIAFSAVFAR